MARRNRRKIMFVNKLQILGTLALSAGVMAPSGPAEHAVKAEQPSKVTLLRVPHRGIQPQVAVDAKGTVHLIYYSGSPGAGDIFYIRSEDGGTSFSTPLRVNSRPGSAIALGNMRGAHLAVGKGGRVHVS
jgi:hypothetical protein